MDIETGIGENQEIIVKISLRSKCYEFWFINHPICFLWIWLLSVLTFSIIFSEFHKKH